MSSRMERRAYEEAQRKTKWKKLGLRLGIPLIALVVVAAIVFIFAVVKPFKNNHIESIEKVVPDTADALFITKNNDGSWEYLSALTDKNITKIKSAQYVGASFVDGETYLYLQGNDEDKLRKEIKRNATVNESLSEKDGVFVLGKDSKGVAKKNSLLDNSTYKSNKPKNKRSVAYLTNKNFKNQFPATSGLPQGEWVWQGTFVDDQWKGNVRGMKAQDFDLDRFNAWASVSKKPSWYGDLFTAKNKDVSFKIGMENVSDFTGLPKYDTQISDISINITNDGFMFISLGKD